MTRDETKQLAALIDALWPDRIKFGSGTIDAWTLLFEDDAFDEIRAALTTHAQMGEPHPPTPGQLHAAVAEWRVPSLAELKPWMRRTLPPNTPADIRVALDELGGHERLAMMTDDEVVTAYSRGLRRMAHAITHPSVLHEIGPGTEMREALESAVQHVV